MSARRGVAALLAMMLGAALISVLPGSLRASAALADGAATDSAITLSGKTGGEFEKLQVTVSQTKDLINQVVTVSWKGGKPTQGYFAANFLQIMQCWGDDGAGPDRTQCQFGMGSAPITNGLVLQRALAYDNVIDPKEKLTLPAGSPTSGQRFVPFWPVGRPKLTDAVSSNSNDFYDAQSTNEIPLARTRFDGTGQEFFEVQTLREAAGLGCGEQVVTAATTGRKCWLVVVPRGNTEVDGSPRTGTGDPRSTFLQSSPLSQSNWDNRIVFPLEFVPVGNACPIGAAERRLVGHELATDAVGRWQPALCAGGGANFSYTQLSDDVTRNQVLDGSSPGLALVTNPVPPDQAPPDRPLVYAPVGLSGLTIAFNIKHRPLLDAPLDKLQLEGQPFLSMKLTPRLVAKLLTQSYQDAVVGRQQQLTPDYLKKNPVNLLVDPEFLDLNPEYKDFTLGGPSPPADMLVQLGGSDLTSLLWSWVKADPDASAFLAGTPDDGMVVNPKNEGLSLPTTTFPRQDQTCIDVYITTGVTPKSCTLDVHPFTNDMHDAGRSAARGDSLARVPAQDANNQVVPAKVPRQGDGLMAVVDAATAARYGLPTASLRNAGGQFVTPATDNLVAGEKAMKPSAVPGVLATDPGAADPAAYPLTALSYAVASPSNLDAAAGKDYATFLRYAAGPGQQLGAGSGRLPLGMAPLPDALKAQTTTAAATIEAQAGKTPGGPPPPQLILPGDVPGGAIGPTGGPSSAPGSDATTTNSGSGPSAPGAGVPPPGLDSPAPTAPNLVQQPVAVRRTPSLPVPAVGALLLVILISGALAATSSPVLQSSVVHRLGAVVRRVLRRGVRPTEQ